MQKTIVIGLLALSLLISQSVRAAEPVTTPDPAASTSTTTHSTATDYCSDNPRACMNGGADLLSSVRSASYCIDNPQACLNKDE